MAFTIRESQAFQLGQFRAHVIAVEHNNASPHAITKDSLMSAGFTPFAFRNLEAVLFSGSTANCRVHVDQLEDPGTVTITAPAASGHVTILLLGN